MPKKVTSKSPSVKMIHPTVRNSLMAGSVAGMSSTLVCHPFDVVRVRMQAFALSSTTPTVTATVRNLVQQGGVRALYTGLALPLTAQAIYKATVFTVNNLTQDILLQRKKIRNSASTSTTAVTLTTTDRFICGCMGGAVNGALFVTPVEFVRNQLIFHSSKQKTTPLAVIRSTWMEKGPQGLWRGMMSTVLRDSIGCGCFFVAMAAAQQSFRSYDDETPSTGVVVLSGAAAGVSFWIWALPIDTLKTWIQNGSATNLRQALSQVNSWEKAPQLFRGWPMAYGRGAPSAAITVTTYSTVYHFLTQQAEPH